MVAATSTKKSTKKSTNIFKHPIDPDVSNILDLSLSDYKTEHWVPLAWVYPNPEQPRTVFPDEMVQERADSLIANGQRTAIDVMYRPLTKKDFESGLYANRRNLIHQPNDWTSDPDRPILMIKNGECRFRGTHRAGKEVIRVRLCPLLEGADLLIEATADNTERKQMSEMDEARVVHRLITEYGMSEDQVAKHFGWTKAQQFRVAWRLGLMNLSQRWQKVADNNGFQVEIEQPDGTAKLVFVEVGGDRLRVASQIGLTDDDGDFQPNHKLQNLLLDELISYAKEKKGSTTWTVAKMKAVVKAYQTPIQKTGGFDLIMPRSETTQGLVNDLSTLLRKAAGLIIKAYESQQAQSPSRCIEYFGDREAQATAEIIAKVIKALEWFKQEFEARAAKAFVERGLLVDDDEVPDLEDLENFEL